MSNEIRYLGTRQITATLTLKSGLHIGAGKDAVEIGGIDSPVIRHPITREPYVPGSSIKGKLRSLLEWALDRIEPDGKPWGSGAHGEYAADDPVLRIFGAPPQRGSEWTGGPTRLIVRDAPLDPKWVEEVRGQGLGLTEEKTEVSIDRIQGKAANIGPRRMERVPAGARFELEMRFKLYDTGDGGATDRACLNRLLEALRLLEGDALGGSGSRGYGRVAIEDLCVDGHSLQERFEGLDEIRKEAPAAIYEGATGG